MGYRSDVYLKTTTEGYLIMKRFNDSLIVEDKSERPLTYATISYTPTGFYRIEYNDVKWYDSYPEVQNFNKALDLLRKEDIPYAYIEIGEDPDDITYKCNYSAELETPTEIANFQPVVDVGDDDFDYTYLDEDD